MNINKKCTGVASGVVISTLLATLTACGGSSSDTAVIETPNIKPFEVVQGLDNNSKANPLLSLNTGGPGGSSNQSLRAGDILAGSAQNNTIIGGLGTDVLLGYGGNDILIGGTEDFNSSVDGDGRGSDNRDRAFGHEGDDVFIWAPGDGSDFFDGGEGTDVVIFGVLGEQADATGNATGAPFFNVNPPGSEGSQDFDGIYLNTNNQPQVRVSASPGFCSIVDANANNSLFAQLNIDHVVRFSLRGIANAFDAGDRTDDDGLRVAVTIKNTEYVVCTTRSVDTDNSANNIDVFDVSEATPFKVEFSDLPEYVQALIQ